jgi:hypothetical protein
MPVIDPSRQGPMSALRGRAHAPLNKFRSCSVASTDVRNLDPIERAFAKSTTLLRKDATHPVKAIRNTIASVPGQVRAQKGANDFCNADCGST